MKVLGISGSTRLDHSTDILVKEVLSTVGVETEFISLAGKVIGPCIACLGCIKDSICKVNDDMLNSEPGGVNQDAIMKHH